MNLELHFFKMAKIVSKLFTMVRENLEFHSSQMAKSGSKLSTIIGEKMELHFSQMAKNVSKLSTMVGENLDFHTSQIGDLTPLKWLKLHLDCPSWMKKIWNLTRCSWSEIVILHINSPTCAVEEASESK